MSDNAKSNITDEWYRLEIGPFPIAGIFVRSQSHFGRMRFFCQLVRSHEINLLCSTLYTVLLLE